MKSKIKFKILRQHCPSYAYQIRSYRRINDTEPQATGAPTSVTTVSLTGLPYLKKGPLGARYVSDAYPVCSYFLKPRLHLTIQVDNATLLLSSKLGIESC
ncbi:hypothetical protein TNCV_1256571 [Trichonephila clavipes]|nr:hypothetical protein TNCV_1256571 [Trichonephila clavipes]